MGLFLLILEYQKANNLPLESIFRDNWSNMNGEDIGLPNRSQKPEFLHHRCAWLVQCEDVMLFDHRNRKSTRAEKWLKKMIHECVSLSRSEGWHCLQTIH